MKSVLLPICTVLLWMVVDESRKRVLGIMASILAARKLANCRPARRVPATMNADAVR
jgi:hypothetical protein